MPELAASLPVFAIDGTLKDRHAPGAAGMAHLKGGTLNGVQSIAGYVLDRRGRRWIVVMMVNHPNANAAAARARRARGVGERAGRAADRGRRG